MWKVLPAVDKQALSDSCAMWRFLCGGSATLWNSSIPDLNELMASATFSACWNGKQNESKWKNICGFNKPKATENALS